MSFTTDFVAKYNGQTLGYPAGSYVGECLSLVKIYIKERYGINPPPSGCNAARCYWSVFPDPLGSVLKRVPNTPELVPQEGWIGVWDGDVGNGYGHIDIVLKGATTSQFTGFDQNWGGRHAHTVTHNYNNVYGFLVPKEEDMATIEVPIEDWEKVRTNSETLDKVTDRLKVPRNSKFDVISKKMDEVEKSKYDQGYNKGYEKGKEESPVVPSPDPNIEFVVNGKTETSTKDGVTTTINYAVKG